MAKTDPAPVTPDDGGLSAFTAGLASDTGATDPTATDQLGDGGVSGTHYIGVPDNYAYAAPGSSTTSKPTPGGPAAFRLADSGSAFAPVGPIYHTGDELTLASMAPEDVWVLQQRMSQAGLIGPKTKFRRGDGKDATTITAFKKLLGYANRGGTDFTTALGELLATPLTDATDGSGAFTGTRKRTDRSVQLSDPKTAQELADSVLERHLGRAATRGEYAKFVAALNGAEQANPVVSNTSASYQAGVETGSNTTTTGGLDAGGKQKVIEDQITKDPKLKAEQDKFVTETDYFNAAMAALGSPT